MVKKIVLCCLAALCLPLLARAEEKSFAQFELALPPGWSGDEQTGFVSEDPREYQLTLGRMDEAGERFLAQVSIFLLPNKNGVTAKDAALKLAEAQGGSSEPAQEGNFWVFTGEPRSKTVTGVARTMVNTTPEMMLIIIAQDPEQLGSAEILKSLRGVTPLARQLLGR